MKLLSERDLRNDRIAYEFSLSGEAFDYCIKICSYSKYDITNVELVFPDEEMMPEKRLQFSNKYEFLEDFEKHTDIQACRFGGMLDNSTKIRIGVNFSWKSILVACPNSFSENVAVMVDEINNINYQ